MCTLGPQNPITCVYQHHGMQQHKCAPICTCTSSMVAINMCVPTYSCSNTYVHQDQYPRKCASAPQWPKYVPQHHGSPNYVCTITTVSNMYASVAAPVSSDTCVSPKTTEPNHIHVHASTEQSRTDTYAPGCHFNSIHVGLMCGNLQP